MMPIEAIAYFQVGKAPEPLRFRLTDPAEKEQHVIAVDRVLCTRENRHAGNTMICYDCEGIIHRRHRRFELRYEISSCKWYLYKY